MIRDARLAFLSVLTISLAACDQRNVSAAIAKADSIAPETAPAVVAQTPAPIVIDSALPLDEELRRFRAGLARVTTFEHAAHSRDALVQDFLRALERADTAALVRLHITRAEFAWLIYPTSVESHPPYHQPPDVAWLLAKAATENGLNRVLARRAGQPLGVVGYSCDPQPTREGENRIWRGCELRVASGAGIETARQRLFGAIIERGGRFKFLSYENQF